MTAGLITNEEFWHDADLMLRLKYKKENTRPWGTQYHLQFINGYGMSIINGAGSGVEVMILDAEDGTVAGEGVPIEALVWIREMLADDTVIAHLNPAELRDIILDVAYWPDHTPQEGITDGENDHG